MAPTPANVMTPCNAAMSLRGSYHVGVNFISMNDRRGP